MQIFEYGKKETDYLSKKDKTLGKAIDRIGMIERKIINDPFEALISSVISQQISKKAGNTVLQRLYLLLGTLNPENIENTSITKIQECGMTTRKAGYIKGIASAAINDEVNFNELHKLNDKDVITKLSSLKGVGVWTAEMLLIHSLSRPNVVSFGDLAIRRGMMNLYGINELTRECFDNYVRIYSPYGSVASLYLWALS